MDIHAITEYEPFDVNEFEADAVYGRRGLIPQIQPRYRYPYFLHIFDGGYASGYYFYIWAQVLDKDAFRAFEQTGDDSTVRPPGNSGRCFLGAVRRTV